MKLYELDSLARKLEEALESGCDPETGELLEDDSDLRQTYDAIETERESKLLWLGALFQEAKAEAEAVASTIKTLQARKRATENRMTRLKSFIGEFLAPNEKLADGRVKIGWRKNPPSIELEEDWDHKLPLGFIKVEPTPKKREILQALKDGKEIKGARIASESYAVSIR